jgi:acetate kinase
MIRTLLVLNAGSSSLKFKVFGLPDLALLAGGQVSRIGGEAAFDATVASGERHSAKLARGTDHEAALAAVLAFLDRHDDGWQVAGVVHRVVHGGTSREGAVVVTPRIVAELEALSPLAPLHQPHNLAGIAAAERLVGKVPGIACFDTAFHASLEPLFTTLALGRDLRDKGLRRYGFHGVSYQWIARVLAERHPRLAAGRVVAAHLGNGASLCAMLAGRSIDTTMGMTALDGLPMGTRSGALDPGAVIYMLRNLGMDVDEVEAELYERSGLRGLSGLTNDVKALLESREPDARFALEYFALKVAQYAAMMATSLGGIDAMVFTGGIGENAQPVREAVVGRMAFLGAFDTLVIPTDEERMMAIQARALVETRP